MPPVIFAQDQYFKIITHQLSEKYKLPQNTIVLYLNDRLLGAYDSPKTVRISITDIIGILLAFWHYQLLIHESTIHQQRGTRREVTRQRRRQVRRRIPYSSRFNPKPGAQQSPSPSVGTTACRCLWTSTPNRQEPIPTNCASSSTEKPCNQTILLQAWTSKVESVSMSTLSRMYFASNLSIPSHKSSGIPATAHKLNTLYP